MSDGMTDDAFAEQRFPGFTDAETEQAERRMEQERRMEGSRFFGKKVDDFPIIPTRVFIWVQEFGQPNRSEGGIYIASGLDQMGQSTHAAYRLKDERYGRVIAVGPGHWHEGRFFPLDEPNLGEVVLFSKRHGTRFAMKYHDCWIRVIDPIQCVGVVEDFEPWWDIIECQEDPEGTMTG